MKESEVANPLTVGLRLASVPFVAIGVRQGIHPNTITFASLTIGCVAGALYFLSAFALAAALWIVSVLLDYSDGTVARLSKKESYAGYLFDVLGDRLKLITLLIAWVAAASTDLAFILAGTCIAVLIGAEIVNHLLVAQSNSAPVPDGGDRIHWRHALYQVLIKFDMHTFLLYGIFLCVGERIAYVATGWLLVVLLEYLRSSTSQRVVIKSGRVHAEINRALVERALRIRR